MTATTIKVDSALRDRLAGLAKERGTTMGALLAEAADRLERESFFRTAKAQLGAFASADPQAWAADRAEARAWSQGTDADTLSAEDEPGWWE